MKKTFRICITQLLASIIILSFFSCSKDDEKEVGGTTPPTDPIINTKFKMTKGVNIGHWLSQTDVRGEQRRKDFKKEQVKFLSDAGFDHLRLPVDEEQLFDEEGRIEYEVVDLIHNFVKWCEEYNLRVILDLHILRSHHFDNPDKPLWTDPAEQDKFIAMWLAIDKEFNSYSETLLAYELLNEAVAPTNADWNKLANKAISELRKDAPTRKIVLAANWYNSISEMKDLEVPEGDKNIILSFHFYEPFPLTHFDTSWTLWSNFSVKTYYPGLLVRNEDYNKLSDYEKGIYGIYKETIYNKAELKRRIYEAKVIADKLDLQLYCGEFGCVLEADDVSRYEWWGDVVSIFDELDIAYTSWGYKGQFGFCNNDDGALLDPKLLSILINKKIQISQIDQNKNR